MVGLILGVILMLIGGGLIYAGTKRNKKVDVVASNGSMAVGGNNTGVMINSAQNNAPPNPVHKSHGGGLTILAIIVELAGIGVTVWHAVHLASK